MEKSTMLSSAVSSKTAVSTFTLTTWRFLIKAPDLGKLSVMYDAENVGLGQFCSDENQ